jgi:hypothetical protein
MLMIWRYLFPLSPVMSRVFCPLFSVPRYLSHVTFTPRSPGAVLIVARCCVGRSNHHVTRPCQFDSPFCHGAKYKGIRELGRSNEEKGYIRHIDAQTARSTRILSLGKQKSLQNRRLERQIPHPGVPSPLSFSLILISSIPLV